MKIQGRFTPTDLGMFVGHIAALCRPCNQRVTLGLEVDVAQHVERASMDPSLLKTVNTNILSNASRYSKTGCIRLQLG
jgi:K+-sensing histidine kinase KdpD